MAENVVFMLFCKLVTMETSKIYVQLVKIKADPYLKSMPNFIAVSQIAFVAQSLAPGLELCLWL